MKNDKRIPRITFDEDSAPFVLSAFGKTIDSEGFIVDASNHKQKVLTSAGEEIHITEFAGVKKGSEIYIKKDLTSTLKIAKKEL